MMSLDLFKDIIKQVAPITELVCLHLMGEPLAHPKIFDFIQACADHQVNVFLVTNGTLLKDDRFQILLHPIIKQVNFSVHSFNDNYPEKDPTKYLNTIFNFTERAFIERPDLYINYRLWNLSTTKGSDSKNLESLKKIEHQYQIQFTSDFDVRKQKSFKIKNRLYLHYDTEFIWPALDLPVLGEYGKCLGLKSHFGILADGTVVPCCLDKEGLIPLGHVEKSSIQSILENEKSQAILNGFKKGILIEDLCKRCNYIQRFKK